MSGYFRHWANNVSAQIDGPFVGGETISVADLKVFVAMRSYTKGVYDYIPGNVLEPYPKITGLMDAVAAHPRVVDWYEMGRYRVGNATLHVSRGIGFEPDAPRIRFLCRPEVAVLDLVGVE